MNYSAESIKELRQLTNAGVVDCKKALEKVGGDINGARKVLKEMGKVKAAKKSGRQTSQGIVHAYIHHDGKAGALVKILCETDFVARTPEFEDLAHSIAMQVVALNPATVEELLDSDYIRDPGKKISGLISEAVGRLGENITVGGFATSVI